MKIWNTENGISINQILSGRSNSFLLSNGERCLLIDTGRRNKWGTLTKRIEKICGRKSPLAGLILTHTHFDHVENAAALKENCKIPIIVQKNEAGYLAAGHNPPIVGTVFLTRCVTDLFGKKLESFYRYRPAEEDILVDDRYDLNTFGFDAAIIHTPGHTAGSMSIIVHQEIAIVGDTMFGMFNESVFTPFADQPSVMVRSWGKLLDTSCSLFLPGHGGAVERELLQREYDKYKIKYQL